MAEQEIFQKHNSLGLAEIQRKSLDSGIYFFFLSEFLKWQLNIL